MINASKDLYIKAQSSGGGGTGTTSEGILYNRPIPFDNKTYDLYDEGWHWSAGTYNFSGDPSNPAIIAKLDNSVGTDIVDTLVENNLFGNKFRYTDEEGNEADGTNDLMMDHLQGLMFYIPASPTNETWYVALDAAHTGSTGGYSDWRLPGWYESNRTLFKGDGGTRPSMPIARAQTRLWTSTTRIGNDTIAYDDNWGGNAVGAISTGRSKTQNGSGWRGVWCRTFYWDDPFVNSIYNPI